MVSWFVWLILFVFILLSKLALYFYLFVCVVFLLFALIENVSVVH
jgi:hypothetical protein